MGSPTHMTLKLGSASHPAGSVSGSASHPTTPALTPNGR